MVVVIALGHVVRNANLMREAGNVCGTCHVQIIISGAYDSARCALNSDGFFLGSCAGVSCCLDVPDDSRTEDSTVGGREDGRIGFADESGFWNEGELMIVVVMGAAPGGGAKDGESMIIMGADASGTGREPTTRVGGDGGDGRDVMKRAVPCSDVSVAPPSRRASSSAMVGGRTARSSLNLDPFLGGSPGGAEGVGEGAVRGVCLRGAP